ncbi:hypothetical protein HK096_008224, partial [Nowakowskiella sp. JEL0078]
MRSNPDNISFSDLERWDDTQSDLVGDLKHQVIWDYHVIAILKKSTRLVVYDLDTTIPKFP